MGSHRGPLCLRWLARREPLTSTLGGPGSTSWLTRASTTSLPRKLLEKSSKLKEPVGYRSFRLADASVVANEGTLLGDEVLELRALVAATLVSGPSHLPTKQGDFGPEGVLP